MGNIRVHRRKDRKQQEALDNLKSGTVGGWTDNQGPKGKSEGRGGGCWS